MKRALFCRIVVGPYSEPSYLRLCERFPRPYSDRDMQTVPDSFGLTGPATRFRLVPGKKV
jgi:hypothetical protein